MFVLLFACIAGTESPDAPAAPPAAPAPTAAPAATPPTAASPSASPSGPTGAPPLPDLTKGLTTTGCDHGPGVVGAVSYFTGTFTIDGDRVTGEERWLLYANQKLQDSKFWTPTGGKDACVVRWKVSGRIDKPRFCGDCDLAIVADSVLDVASSTCPEDLIEREKEMKLGYDVHRSAGGTAKVYFSASGKPLGEGYHASNGFNYITDPDCRWF